MRNAGRQDLKNGHKKFTGKLITVPTLKRLMAKGVVEQLERANENVGFINHVVVSVRRHVQQCLIQVLMNVEAGPVWDRSEGKEPKRQLHSSLRLKCGLGLVGRRHEGCFVGARDQPIVERTVDGCREGSTR